MKSYLSVLMLAVIGMLCLEGPDPNVSATPQVTHFDTGDVPVLSAVRPLGISAIEPIADPVNVPSSQVPKVPLEATPLKLDLPEFKAGPIKEPAFPVTIASVEQPKPMQSAMPATYQPAFQPTFAEPQGAFTPPSCSAPTSPSFANAQPQQPAFPVAPVQQAATTQVCQAGQCRAPQQVASVSSTMHWNGRRWTRNR